MVRVKVWHTHTTVLLKNYSQRILTYYTRILLLDLTYGGTMSYIHRMLTTIRWNPALMEDDDAGFPWDGNKSDGTPRDGKSPVGLLQECSCIWHWTCNVKQQSTVNQTSTCFKPCKAVEERLLCFYWCYYQLTELSLSLHTSQWWWWPTYAYVLFMLFFYYFLSFKKIFYVWIGCTLCEINYTVNHKNVAVYFWLQLWLILTDFYSIHNLTCEWFLSELITWPVIVDQFQFIFTTTSLYYTDTQTHARDVEVVYMYQSISRSTV